MFEITVKCQGDAPALKKGPEHHSIMTTALDGSDFNYSFILGGQTLSISSL
jgi:hypothetical protein